MVDFKALLERSRERKAKGEHMPNFSSILDMPSSEVKFPKLPQGTYVAIIKGMPEYLTSKNSKNYIRVQFQLVEPTGEVDDEALEEFGPIGEKVMPFDIYFENEYGKNRLDTLLDNCDIEELVNGRKLSIRQRMEDLPGKTVLVEVKHQTSQDGRSIREVIDDTAKYGEEPPPPVRSRR